MFKKLFNPKTERTITKWETKKAQYSRTTVQKGLFNKTVYTSVKFKNSNS